MTDKRHTAPYVAQFAMVRKSFSLDERTVDIVVSTSAIDHDGDILVQDWDLERFQKNPVVLWNHDLESLPIGSASAIGVTKNAETGQDELTATLKFVDARANPVAEQVWQGIVQGSIRACSAGFDPGTVDVATIDGQAVFLLGSNELLEISMCPVPINPDSVAARKSFLEGKRSDANASRAAERQKETDMKQVTKALGLTEGASEADVLAAVTAVQANAQVHERTSKSLLEATGAKTLDEALGTIAALKTAHAELETTTKAFGDLKKQLDDQERDVVIKKAADEKKLTPHQVKELSTQPLGFVKSFVALQVENPALAASEQHEKKSEKVISDDIVGKSWAELTPMQKHNLFVSNRAQYDALRSEHQAKNAH